MSFWTPHIHYAATAIHIFACVFWLGWMFLFFLILRPVAVRFTDGSQGKIMKPIHRRAQNCALDYPHSFTDRLLQYGL